MGLGFEHRIWEKPSSVDSQVNIYLHGDGLPWLGVNKIASDPTGTHRISFELWQSDPNTAYLIGRPCYFGAKGPSCNPGFWTTARYSSSVVDSLSHVVEQIIKRHPSAKISLYGYSGGGTLATLVADQVAEVNEIVTFAAPLDIALWADLHAYSRLQASLNPADMTIRKTLIQRHWLGAQDRNVPYEINQAFYDKHGQQAKIMGGFDHLCCWQQFWMEFGIEK
jgi:pimeloyl-ACP methyl ester carboxylesterase